MTIYGCDISSYQPPVDDTYNLPWLIFRVCDGDYLDPHAVQNAQWCWRAITSGRLQGATAYVVYRPGMNSAIMANLARVPTVGRVMIDIESWTGQIVGDHSDDINKLGDLIAGTGCQVWVYGNRDDLSSIAPSRRAWPVVLASYGDTPATIANQIGWQYTNGQYASGDRPTATAPFGPCDHNELYITALSGGGQLITGDEDDMSKPYLVNDPTGSYIVAADFSSRIRIPDPADVTAISNAGQVIPLGLSSQFLYTIPVPGDPESAIQSTVQANGSAIVAAIKEGKA